MVIVTFWPDFGPAPPSHVPCRLSSDIACAWLVASAVCARMSTHGVSSESAIKARRRKQSFIVRATVRFFARTDVQPYSARVYICQGIVKLSSNRVDSGTGVDENG